MKTKTLPLLLATFFGGAAAAQNGFNAFADMDINNIRARSLVHGDLWHSADTTSNPVCEFPAGSGKNVAYIGGLWLGGQDGVGTIKVAAAGYRSSGLEFWPGPIASGDSAQRFAVAGRWNKIWSITYAEVQQHLSHSSHTLFNTPQAVLRWPGKGNPDAQDAFGQPLGNTAVGAPFVDVNSNGTYEPLQGDYPKMRGDKMHWWLFNDDTYIKLHSQTLAMGVEVGASAWAFQNGSSIDNVIFYSYDVTNKSGGAINNLRAGFWSDVEIGYGFDDDAWYDSTRRMGVAFNAAGTDQVYGTNIPAAGIMLMEQPGDSYSNRLLSGNMMRYYNNVTQNGNPENGIQMYNYLNRFYKNGTPATFSWNAALPCSQSSPQNDVRLVVNSAPYGLAAGATLRFSMALIVCPAAGGCPLVHLDCMNASADHAWDVYWNGRPTTTAVSQTAAQQLLQIHPNPANDMLYVSASAPDKLTSLEVYDATGRQVPANYEQKGGTISLKVAGLAPGVYHLRCVSGGQVQQGSFVRQ